MKRLLMMLTLITLSTAVYSANDRVYIDYAIGEEGALKHNLFYIDKEDFNEYEDIACRLTNLNLVRDIDQMKIFFGLSLFKDNNQYIADNYLFLEKKAAVLDSGIFNDYSDIFIKASLKKGDEYKMLFLGNKEAIQKRVTKDLEEDPVNFSTAKKVSYSTEKEVEIVGVEGYSKLLIICE